jgi:hypothetical protein
MAQLAISGLLCSACQVLTAATFGLLSQPVPAPSSRRRIKGRSEAIGVPVLATTDDNQESALCEACDARGDGGSM